MPNTDIEMMEWHTSYSDVEFYIAGPTVDDLKSNFDEFGDNPEVAALFQVTDLYDENGEYNGDGCNRLEMRKDYLYAAMDGLSDDVVAILLKDCKDCAERNPDLSYMLVGAYVDEEADVQCYDVLLLRGFNADNNPLKREHGKFYDEYVVRGI